MSCFFMGRGHLLRQKFIFTWYQVHTNLDAFLTMWLEKTFYSKVQEERRIVNTVQYGTYSSGPLWTRIKSVVMTITEQSRINKSQVLDISALSLLTRGWRQTFHCTFFETIFFKPFKIIISWCAMFCGDISLPMTESR